MDIISYKNIFTDIEKCSLYIHKSKKMFLYILKSKKKKY